MCGMKKRAFLLLATFLTAVFVLSGGIRGTYAEASETAPAEAAGNLVLESDGYYYYYIGGVMQTGWQTITQDGVENTYYFFETKGTQPVGTAAVGLRKIGTNRYYFSSSGVMQTGWKTISGRKYYFYKTKTSSNYGQAAVGLKKIGNYRYYFSSTGVMQTGKKKINGSLYYFKSNGRARTGWFTVGSKLYYASSSGKLKTNTTYQSVTFTKNGYAKSNTASKLKIKCMKIVSSITTSSMTKSQKLKACWNYMTNRSRWSYRTIYLSSYTSGWQRTVAYNMLTSGSGNCYSFACAFAALAHEVGYTPYVVVGRVSGTRDGASDGLTRHCWVKINGLYYDPEAYFAGWWTGCYGVSTYSIRHTIIGTYKFI